MSTTSTRTKKRHRKGATVVEFALIAPVVFLLLIGFAVLSLGVFRYQQLAYLARHGARYASRHGAQYRVDNRLAPGDQATWTDEIRNESILPRSTSLDADQLVTTVAWTTGDNRANASEDG